MPDSLTVSPATGMSLSEMKAFVRNHFEEFVNRKNINIGDVNFAPEFVDHGADAVVVSNHGGRQLDDVPSTIRSLPAIAEAVGAQCEVLMDGGIRSGLDVVKAMSMGTRACLLGRAWAYAVAARGERGVDHVLRIIQSEMMVTLGLTGVNDVRDLDRTVVVEE